MKFPNIASFLKSATTNINIASATAPSNGQVLTATSSTTAAWQTVASWGGWSTQSTFVAWENITAWNALRNWRWNTLNITSINNLTSATDTQSSWTRIWYNTSEQYIWQSFTLTWVENYLNSISVKLWKTWSPTWNLTMKIYSDTWNTLVATSTNTISESSITTWNTYTFTFNSYIPTWIPLYIRIETSRANSTSAYSFIFYTSINSIAWDFYQISSTNSWSILYTYDMWINVNTSIIENITDIFKTNALLLTTSNFLWFATNTATTWQNVIVDTSWVSNTQSGLTVWSDYYLWYKYIYTTWSEYVNDPYSTTNRQTWNRYYMQKFVADFKMVSNVKAHVACTSPSSSSVNMTCDIYNVSWWVPTTLLKSWPTINVAYDWDSNFATEYSFYFTWNVWDTEMTIWNTYAVVFSAPSDSYQIWIAYPNTLTTTYGSWYKYNGASSWTTSTNDVNINITWKNYTWPFDWWISTTPWTNSKKCWKAVSTTWILVNPFW